VTDENIYNFHGNIVFVMISDRVSKVAPSATLEITAKAKALRDEGVDVVGLGAGEPDFDTPEHIKKALYSAVEDGIVYYTPTPGFPALREAIAEKLKGDNGIDYDPTGEIISTPGAKQALYEAILTVVDPGDEVLIPDPWWVSYVPMVQLADGKAVFVPTTEENGFNLTSDAIQEKITDKSRVLILNSPSNPTGSVLSKSDLKRIADVCIEHDILVISDEIYEYIIYGSKHESIASLDGMKERTITINGMSKAYSMTGWRLGYAAGPPDIIKGMTRVQAHSISNVTSFVQMAGIVALKGPQDCVTDMVKEFKKRREVVTHLLNEIPDVTCVEPKGAFYAFANVSAYEKDSFKLSNYLLEEKKVAVVPGGAFGECGDGYLRLSYATSMDNINEGISRIEKGLKEYG
jgi:aspartate aminotransferase